MSLRFKGNVKRSNLASVGCGLLNFHERNSLR